MFRFNRARIPMGRDKRLTIEDWTLASGDLWVVLGEGGSGKSSLAKALAGLSSGSSSVPPKTVTVTGTITPMQERGEKAAFISFDREREIRDEIRKNDDSEWMGKPDEGSTVIDFIGGNAGLQWLSPALAEKLRGRGIRNLSTGEFRQVLIAREASKKPALAILDEPFEGLDIEARPRLTEQLRKWHDSGILIVLTVNRREDVPSFASGLVVLKNSSVRVHGISDSTWKTENSVTSLSSKSPVGTESIPPPPSDRSIIKGPLVEMTDVALAYQGRVVLDCINWTIRPGESWLLTGPNGSGKTSLLNLICGDEPRAYGQDIRVFGRKKGSGESTQWIKSNMGIVSASLQETVSRHATAEEVIGSGLRDAMVLSEPLDGYEKRSVGQWLQALDLLSTEAMPFYRLPYGERRLAMLGRAMIKHPPLLLLDEPMHGLDSLSRQKVTRLLDRLISDTGTSIIYVSHRPDDAPKSITHHLRLIPDDDRGPSKAVLS